MNVLGIETSCDETAVAVVADGNRILSNVVSSQVELHARYGGVVPELASREHVQAMVPVLDEALREASVVLDGIDAIAVTHGPASRERFSSASTSPRRSLLRSRGR